MIFKVISVKYISTTATITDSGIDAAITSVGFMSFKNKSNTKIASIAPTIIFSITLFTTMSMYTPWFISTVACNPSFSFSSESSLSKRRSVTSPVE